MKNTKVILASKSPRRNELLRYLFDDFEIISSNVEEICDDSYPPEKRPELFAVMKGKDIAQNNLDSLVIAADTMVLVSDIILGKPKTKDEAIAMLSILSGRVHKVITGVYLSYQGKSISFSSETNVEFYKMSAEEIIQYIESNEWIDKAGGYAIQGKAAPYIKSINGDYFNVVGLPIGEIRNILKFFIK